MSYQKQNFVGNQVLNSGHLNHIEDGIAALESSVNTSFTGKADKSEVQANAKSISSETTRAKAAEKANADNLAAEVSRATGEEQRLNTAIAAENTRAEQAEQALSARTDALESCGFVVVDGKVCMKYVKS